MKFAFVSDSHLGPSPYYAKQNCIMSAQATELLHRVATELVSEPDLSFIVHLGDIIQESRVRENSQGDLGNLRKARDLLTGLGLPVYYVAGNHDVRTLSGQTFCSELNQDKLYFSFDVGGFHFVVLCCETNADESITLPAEQLEWLEHDLSKSSSPVCVFVHHPLGDIHLESHKWYNERPDKCLVANRAEVRALFERSGRVRVVLNGHAHYQSFCQHCRIPYITLQSLVENFCDKDIPSACYGIAELSAKALTVNIRGQQKARYFFEFD